MTGIVIWFKTSKDVDVRSMPKSRAKEDVSKPKSWWGIQKFGKLRLKNPIALDTDSKRSLDWVCECGKGRRIPVCEVTKGVVKSCGHCKKPRPKKKPALNFKRHLKSELLSKIEEIDYVLSEISIHPTLRKKLEKRRKSYVEQSFTAYEDIMSAAISSHKVMCEVKNMKPDEAFGNNPFIYYGLGLAGEAGELTGALLRAMRNGGSFEDMKTAAESELADCMIYAVILAYSTGIDLVQLVNEKARIVELRARSGYYGGPLPAKWSK